MTAYFVTRHPGAREWAERQGISVEQLVAHLDTSIIEPGDIVLGTLPVHLAAEVCRRGGRYLHLILDVPARLRGQALTAGQMDSCGARLREFYVTDVVPASPIAARETVPQP